MDTQFNQKIEKIICPFDFTSTGRAGMEYAGMLSEALGASLTIFYVQPSVWPEALQLYEDRNESTKAVKRLLQVEALGMQDIFGIKCNYAIEPTTDTIEVAIGTVSEDYDLIVMGTNGADDLYQHVFGTNSHHVLGLAKCPVLMVPEGYMPRLPKLIVYAFDPESNPVFLVNQLETLARPLKATVSTIHVLPELGSGETEQKMELLGDMLGVKERKGYDWHFEPVYSDEVVSAVDGYMKEHNPDLLALSYRHRTFLEKLFRKNVIKEVSRIADYPLLVFWH